MIQTLVHIGIGGERSSGCGSLTEYQKTNFEFKINHSELKSSLSLIAANQNELTDKSLYQAIKRGGRFLEKGNYLQMIQMLLEGAVYDNEIKGRLFR